jgi:hypothetical protein
VGREGGRMCFGGRLDIMVSDQGCWNVEVLSEWWKGAVLRRMKCFDVESLCEA